MKNIFTNTRKGFLMVTLFTTLLSFANENPTNNINVAALKTTVSINNVKEGSLLTIKNNEGSVLYTESIKKSGFYSKEFDLSFLENGNYMFEVDKDLEIREIPFTINSGVVVFKENKEKIIYKPFIRVEGDMLYISKLTVDNEPLIIDIFFTENKSSYTEVMVSKNISTSQKIELAYKLENLKEGSYKVVLDVAGRVYEKSI